MDKAGSFTGPSNSTSDDKLKIFGSLVSTLEFALDSKIEGSFEIPLLQASCVNMCFLLESGANLISYRDLECSHHARLEKESNNIPLSIVLV
jgi:hypothetical protein